MNYLHMYIRQVTEKAKYLQKPDDYNNHNYNVENSFQSALHGYVIVDNPKQDACSNDNE
jgi:hypothetical protein